MFNDDLGELSLQTPMIQRPEESPYDERDDDRMDLRKRGRESPYVAQANSQLANAIGNVIIQGLNGVSTPAQRKRAEVAANRALWGKQAPKQREITAQQRQDFKDRLAAARIRAQERKAIFENPQQIWKTNEELSAAAQSNPNRALLHPANDKAGSLVYATALRRPKLQGLRIRRGVIVGGPQNLPVQGEIVAVPSHEFLAPPGGLPPGTVRRKITSALATYKDPSLYPITRKIMYRIGKWYIPKPQVA